MKGWLDIGREEAGWGSGSKVDRVCSQSSGMRSESGNVISKTEETRRMMNMKICKIMYPVIYLHIPFSSYIRILAAPASPKQDAG